MVVAKVTSDVLFSGRIEVIAPSRSLVSKDVEVAGGTTKTFLMVVPSGFDQSAIEVRLYAGDELVSRKSVAMRIAEEVELVGVLPALVTRVGKLPEQVSLATESGKAQLAELTLDQMALGSAALDVFDTIAGTTADLRSLQPAQRAALLGWLNRGGRLLLDDDADLSALPAEWRPTVAGWALAGRGEVRLIDGEASSGRWASIIEPSGTSTSELNGFNSFFDGEQPVTVEADLAARAGVRLPSMVPLLLPLVTYWVLVSLVLFFVLKAMRRLTLAWVAIPMLALLTSGAVVWYGQQWRAAGKPAASVFVDGYPGGGDATASLLAFSRDGGTVKVDLPAQWQSDSELPMLIGPPAAVASEVRPALDGTQLRLRLEPGQVTTANLVGATGDTGLVAEAGVQGDKVVGTVTNSGPLTLYQVAVFGPGGVADVGTLAPGKSADFTFGAQAIGQGFGRLGAVRVWDGISDPRAADDEVAELGLWSNASLGRVMYPSGMVRTAGWTTLRSAGIEVSGGLTTTTVLTSVAAIQPGGSTLPAASVRWSMARSPFTQFGNGTSDTVYRYVLPPSANVVPGLVIQLPAGLSAIELWNGTGWAKATGTNSIVKVTTTDVVRGVLMARIPNDGNFFPADQAPALRGQTSKDAL